MAVSELESMALFATELATRAMSLARRPVDRANIRAKADTSLVTTTDHAIQVMIRDAVRERYPEHALLGEETIDDENALRPLESEVCWVIDPLDGTRNYVGGLPCFSTSIGILVGGVPVAAAISESNLGRVYTATRGHGAFTDGQRMTVRDPEPGRSALVGFTTNLDPVSVALVSRWAAMPGVVVRNLGSTAFHLAMIASGALATVYSRKCKIWDIAAGVLLVEEAGGILTDHAGEKLFPFDLSRDPEDNLPVLAGAPQTHARLLATVSHESG